MATTTYDINVRYQLEDRATKGAKKIGSSLQKTSRHAIGLGSTLKNVAALAGAGFGMGIAKKFLIDYNASLQETKLRMTGLMQLNLGGVWADNQKEANRLIEHFKEDAKASAGTMQDFAEFAGMITGPVLRAGLSMKDLREITQGGVVAAKAFGVEAGMAALDIEQALAGTLSKKDRFARALLEPMGLDTETWNKMAKEQPEKLGENLVKAFNQPALKQMAESYKSTWAGVTSSLQDSLQQTLGKVGIPLMAALQKEVVKMNDFFEKNPKKIEAFVTKFSGALMDGFKFVKEVVTLIVKHSSTLLSIAKAFIAFKVIRGVGGMLAGPFDMMAKFGKQMGTAGTAADGFANKMTGIGNKLSLAAGLMAAAFAAATLIADAVDRSQERDLQKVGRLPQQLLDAPTDELGTVKTVTAAKDLGFVKNGKFDKAAWDKQVGVEKTRGAASNLGLDILAGATGGLVGRDIIGRTEGGDPRSEAAQRHIIEALKKDTDSKSKAFDEWANKFSGIVDRLGVLAVLGRTDEQQPFRFGEEDRSFVGPTGEGEYAAPQTPKATKKNGDVRIYINQVKVESADPDRFAMHLIGAVTRSTTKPVASRLRLPGGTPA